MTKTITITGSRPFSAEISVSCQSYGNLSIGDVNFDSLLDNRQYTISVSINRLQAFTVQGVGVGMLEEILWLVEDVTTVYLQSLADSSLTPGDDREFPELELLKKDYK